MDKDNDGVLSKEELFRGFSQVMGEDEARAEVDHVFKLFDVDNHNEIDYRGKSSIKCRIPDSLFEEKAHHIKNRNLSSISIGRS